MDNRLSTISCFGADLQRLNNITFVLGLTQSQLVHILVKELELLLSDSIQQNARLGVQSFRYKLITKRVGLTLNLCTVPQAKLVSEKVDMNSPEPSADEIAEKTGVD